MSTTISITTYKGSLMKTDHISRPKLYTSSYVAERICAKLVRNELLDHNEDTTAQYFVLYLTSDNIDNEQFVADLVHGQPSRTLKAEQESHHVKQIDTKEADVESITNQLFALGKDGLGTVLYLDYDGKEELIPLAIRRFDGWELYPAGKLAATIFHPVPYKQLNQVYANLKSAHGNNHYEKKTR